MPEPRQFGFEFGGPGNLGNGWSRIGRNLNAQQSSLIQLWRYGPESRGDSLVPDRHSDWLGTYAGTGRLRW